LSRTVLEGRVPPPPATPIAQRPYQLLQGAAGKGIEVHVIDTGVYCEHANFDNNRCKFTKDFTGEGTFDGNGHGTHVSSTAVGGIHGIAREATVEGVKVLRSNGSGSFANVIAGIAYSAASARTGRKIVVNLSVGGPMSQAVNDAVDEGHKAGMVMAIAAGNSNRDACSDSPSSASLAFTVMSSDSADVRSTFSSYGKCCKLFAPGTGITGAWINQGPRGTNTISGTSMAMPHVAGISAKVWSANPSFTNVDVQNYILRSGNLGLISNPGTGSPNVLALFNCNSTAL